MSHDDEYVFSTFIFISLRDSPSDRLFRFKPLELALQFERSIDTATVKLKKTKFIEKCIFLIFALLVLFLVR